MLEESVGRWDGDTLVVDVANFKDGGWLAPGVFHSDALHLTERYSRVDRDQLNYEATVEDPKGLHRTLEDSGHADAAGEESAARVLRAWKTTWTCSAIRSS